MDLWEQTDNMREALRRGAFDVGGSLILDEAQDLTPLGWAVFHQIQKGYDKSYIIGDDDQNIYSWCGSSAELFLDEPAGRIETLTKSHRIPRAVHRFSQALINMVVRRQKKEFFPRDFEGSVATATAETAMSVLERCALEGKNAMLLARTNYHVGSWADRLTGAGLPFSGLRGKTVWDGHLLRCMNAILRVRRDERVSRQEAHSLLELMPVRGVLQPGTKAEFKRDARPDFSPNEIRKWFLAGIPTAMIKTEHKAAVVSYLG
jgi:superfamily I DNA/RNA helicase